jgi:hypothetical protein
MLIFAFGIGSALWLHQPNNELITNITVIEKYSIGAIPGGKSVQYVPSKIIDEKGNLYIISQEPLWAKLKINQTYEVRIITTNAGSQKVINAVRIDGMWWQ